MRDTELTDERLARLVRDTLAERAGEAPTALAEPLRPGRSRRTAWLLAAAAAVALALPAVARLVPDPPPVQPGSPGPSPTALSPAGWRTESYAGVELRVPPTWGWGGTPVSPVPGGSGVCQVRGASVLPDGTRDANAAARVPFVGRPVLQSDACAMVAPAEARPDVDAVWFASPLPEGERTYADGTFARTVTVAALPERQRVSVFGRDRALVEQVLLTVQRVATDANGCPVDETSVFEASDVAAGRDPQALLVCAYGRPGESGQPLLLFSATRGPGAARAYLAATRSHPDSGTVPCPTGQGSQSVRVGLRASTGLVRWDHVTLGQCSRIELAGGGLAEVVAATVQPWSGPESKAYLTGPWPTGGDAGLAGLFQGVLG